MINTMGNHDSCAILLATCNGSKYLPSLFASLESQTCPISKLFIRDDCSDDSTKELLLSYCLNAKQSVCLIEDNKGRLGTISNFSNLLNNAEYEYLFFCDQDDVWLPGKINKTFSVMQSVEQKYGPDTPILVHTDLCVVDDDLQVLAPSFWKYQNIDPSVAVSVNRILPQNAVTGCTVLINRSLANLASPIPENAIMHDWWLALVAATFGKIFYLDEPTVLYRQHSNNSIGAKKWGLKKIICQALNSTKNRESIVKTINQAELFLNKYRALMSHDLIDCYNNYIQLSRAPRINRIITVFKYRFFKQGLIRNLGFLFNLFSIEDRP